MRKVLTWIALILLYSDCVFAVFTMPICNVEFSGGYRHDNLKWSFAGFQDSPQKFWSMRFSDLQLWQIGGAYSYTTCNNYYIRFSGDYGRILSGNSRTRGFSDDQDDDEFSSIKGKSNRGRVYDIEGCVGYTFTSNGRRFIGTPVIGWAWQYQCLRMHDATQVVNEPGILFDDDEGSGRLGEIHGLSVRYDPRWFGPFAGLDWMVIVEPCFLVYGRAEWHFSEQYRANGSWDLSNRELLNFSHHSHGHGLFLTLGGNYRLGNGWFIGVEGEYRNFQAGKGRHNTKKFEATNSSDVIYGRMPLVRKSEFNSVQWNSYSIEIAINFRYWCDA